MPLDPPITGGLVARVLLEGAILALALIAVTYLLRAYARHVLYVVLLIAALAYVPFAVRSAAEPVWIAIELLGVAIFGGMGWAANGSSPLRVWLPDQSEWHASNARPLSPSPSRVSN